MNARPIRMDIESIHSALDDLAKEIRTSQIAAEVARRQEDEESVRWFEQRVAELSGRLYAIQYLAAVPTNLVTAGGCQ